jgi:hypothetical protein
MKRIGIIGGIVVLVLLLVGAAFVGGRMLSGQSLIDSGGGGPVMMFSSSDSNMNMVSVEMQPAAELPLASPDVAGLFRRREDNSIFVGTGEVTVIARDDQVSAESSGPEMEVVVTHETTVYRDETSLQHTGGSAESKVQQVLAPGSLEEIGENCVIVAWGEERGGRLFADVFVYTAPKIIMR